VAASRPFPTQYEDLTLAEQRLIERVSRFCLRRIADAIQELGSALGKPSPAVMRHFKITGATPAEQEKIQSLIDRYNRIAGVLLGHERLRFDGELTGPAFGLGQIVGKRPPGYVWWLGPVRPGETGEVKIVTPAFTQASLADQGRIVIHEIAHRFLGMTDVKYYEGAGAIKLSTAEAMQNADTYANFAIPVDRSGTRLSGTPSAPRGR
jgi:hypothetical protein